MFLKKHKRMVRQRVRELVRPVVPEVIVSNSSPVGASYPTPKFVVSYHYSLDFPEYISSECGDEEMTLHEARQYAVSLDDRIRDIFDEHGFGDMGEFWGGVALAYHLWPCKAFDSPEVIARKMKCGRWMTPEEIREYVAERGHEPFTDERWITTHYAGINVFRTVDAPCSILEVCV